jgi:hypothetical protein
MEKTDREKTANYLRQFFAISLAGFNMVAMVRESYGSSGSDQERILRNLHAEILTFLDGPESARLTDSEFYAVVDGLLAKMHLLTTQLEAA